MNKMNIFQKLIEVRKTVPYLKKDNAGYQFSYVSSSQTLGSLREATDKYGLLLVPRVKEKTTGERIREELFFKWIHVELGRKEIEEDLKEEWNIVKPSNKNKKILVTKSISE